MHRERERKLKPPPPPAHASLQRERPTVALDNDKTAAATRAALWPANNVRLWCGHSVCVHVRESLID